MGDFKKLKVWQGAHKVACEVYRETSGCGRNGDNEFRRFLRISLGSAPELEYHLLLSRDTGLITPSAYKGLTEQVLRMQSMLAALHRALGRSRGQQKGAPEGAPSSPAR